VDAGEAWGDARRLMSDELEERCAALGKAVQVDSMETQVETAWN